jgi:hypothetical protein
VKARAIAKHIVKGACPTCGSAMSIDAIREDRFKCKNEHEFEVADIVDDMTWKIANRKRAHAEMKALPPRKPVSANRPTGRHARLIQSKAETQVACLGKSQARIQATKMLESAKAKMDAGLIEYFQFLIAEIEAV